MKFWKVCSSIRGAGLRSRVLISRAGRPALLLALLLTSTAVFAQKVEPIPYADFEQWLVRHIKESAIVGGAEQKVYAVAPNGDIYGNEPYINDKSPWGSSNVYARVFGVDKVNVNVTPGKRGDGRCAVLSTQFISFSIMGGIKMNVATAGAIFLGNTLEPIKNMEGAYSCVNMGIPFTQKPKAIVLDYAANMKAAGKITFASGRKMRETEGYDTAVVLLQLQKRWEKDGKIYAKRIATAEYRITETSGWKNAVRIPIEYGKPANEAKLSAFAKLQNFFNAVNSQGKPTPIEEIGWGSADDTPTHLVIYISSGTRGAYMGEIGNKLFIDNVGLEY